MKTQAKQPLQVGIIMGSRADWVTMRHASEMLAKLKVLHEVRVVSARRKPDLLFTYVADAEARGIEVIIAGAADGAAYLPGMAAAKTPLPVLGVPIQSKAMNDIDSQFSIAQMPAGVPVGMLAIGKAGAINAALLAAGILATHDEAAKKALAAFRQRQTEGMPANPDLRQSA
jgi:5-(carboxyamino)imidazole ribonucleotide mutase